MKLLTGLMLGITFSICTIAQTNKIIDWPKNAPEQARVGVEGGRNVATDSKGLEIIEFVVDGKAIVTGQAFSAGDDWLRTFGVRLKNVSDKKIVAIRFHLDSRKPRLARIYPVSRLSTAKI